MTQLLQSPEPQVYQGQFGEYTINERDRAGVIVYRIGLAVAALCFASATNLVLQQSLSPTTLQLLTPLYIGFSLALGVSLATIHIYMSVLHRLLQIFWGIGGIAALIISLQSQEPLALAVYHHPNLLYGVGFTFVALTGIYFKEAFCFNRLETKFLTPLVPFLLLGHLWGFLSPDNQQILLALWSVLFIVFAVRKIFQPLPQDIGDKSVFDYLHAQRSTQN